MSITKLMTADLKRSGLTATDKTKLKIKTLPANRIKKFNPSAFEVDSYLIPYPDINGKFPTPKDKNYYWRIRYMGEIKGKFGATFKKPPRYSGPKLALPRFYLPTTLKIGWAEVAKNVKQPIIFTEGEKKAAKACKENLNCLSVPGVWAWRSKKLGLPSIPDFDLFKWEDRTVYLCFDNDVHDNPMVKGALSSLASELTSRGAHVFIKYLPRTKQKIGLDDYLLKNHVKKWFGLAQEEFHESKELWQMNETCVLVKKVGMIFDYDVECLMSRDQFINTNYAHKKFSVPKANGEGFTEKKTAKEWIEWEKRNAVKALCYRPGEDTITNDNCLNQWPGFKTSPVKGDVKPFLKLLDYLIPNKTHRDWFLKWLAYPIQHPGVKLNTSVIIQSKYQGNGKSFVGFIMGDIYGENFSVVGEEELHSDFNDWRVCKQFIMGEEITGSDKKRDMDKLKAMISSESIRSNAKFEKNYVIEDCANFYLTTNHFNSLTLEINDRRFFVWSVDAPPLEPDFYLVELDGWRRGGGAAHLHHYLLNNIDTSGFRPGADAPITESKQSMIEMSKSDLDLFCERLYADPDNILNFGKASNPNILMSPSEVKKFFNTYPVAAKTMGAALKAQGFPNMRVSTKKGQTVNLYAVRDIEAMRKAPHSVWSKILTNQINKEIKFK